MKKRKGFELSKREAGPKSTVRQWWVGKPIEKKPEIKPGEPWIGYVRPKNIAPNPNQPRKYFGEEEQQILKDSHGVVGQQRAISVIPCRDSKNRDIWFMIHDGERTWRALQGQTAVLVVVNPNVSEADLNIMSFAANFCQQGHTYQETIAAVWRAVKEEGRTPQDVAKAVGWKHTSTVGQYIALHNLTPELQKLMDPPTPRYARIPLQLALIIANAKPEYQMEMYKKAKGKNFANSLHLARKMVDAVRGAGRKRIPSDDQKIVASFLRRISGGLDHLDSLGKEVLCCSKTPIWVEQIHTIYGSLDRVYKLMTDKSLAGRAGVSNPTMKESKGNSGDNGGKKAILPSPQQKSIQLIPLRPISPPVAPTTPARAPVVATKHMTPGQLLAEINRMPLDDGHGESTKSGRKPISQAEEDKILAQFARTDAKRKAPK